MSFFRRERTGIGVDFGTSSVKVVELRGGRDRVWLTTYAIAFQKNTLTQGGDPDSVGRMSVVLRAMAERAKVSRGSVSAALPILSVFSTVINLPVMPERELNAAVILHAKNYVPSPLTEVVLGWTTIGQPTATPAAGTQEVFLTAAPRDTVHRYESVFERVGRKIAALEVESFPLARSLLRGDARPVFLVDLGDRTTSFSVVERGYLRLNQAVDIGGEALTSVIAEKLQIPREQAEARKRSEGLDARSSERGVVAAALRPVVLDLVSRAENIRRLYEQKRGQAVAVVQLIGGGALLPGLQALWTSVTGMPCEVGNPWRGITVPAILGDHLKRLGPSFAVAVGLALRPFEPEG